MRPRRTARWLLAAVLCAAGLAGFLATRTFSAPQAPAAPATGWETLRLDDAPLIYTLEPRAAAVDSQGRLHLAFGGDHLYYALCSADTPADCTVETVDPQDFAGLTAVLALDASDSPRIAYFAGSDTPYCDDEQIKYAFRRGSEWQNEVVAQSCLGEHLALALDASGVPAVTYFDDLWDTLQFAERESPGVWNSFTLDGSLDTVGHVSALAYDSGGDLHAGYLGGDAGGIGLWHRVRSGDTWGEAEAVDSSGYFTRLDMAVDAAGSPHFAYHNQSTSELVYATLVGDQWETETLFEMAYNRTPAITIHNNGQPHIACARAGDLAYTQKTGTSWTAPEAIAASGANPLALARHPTTSQANLVYYDGGELLLTRRSTDWSTAQPIWHSGDTGLFVDLQTAPDGVLHTAYFDRYAGALRYLVYSDTLQVMETPASNVDLGGLSLALDANGLAHIAFADEQGYQQSDLRYVYANGTAWPEHPPLSAAGSDPSLALDSQGTPHVAFTEIVNYQQQVTLATWNGSGWDKRLVAVDSRMPRLLLDGSGVAHISYISGAYPDMTLNLAVEDSPTTWLTSTIDSAGSLYYHDLAMDAQGWLHAVYQVDDPDQDWIPYYAVQTAGGWQSEPVYSQYGETEPRRIALALDAGGAPHIASQYDNNLYYSARTAAGWQTTFWLDVNEVFELDLDTGAYSAIGLANDGDPLIAYYGELDLKLARPLEIRRFYLPLARAH